MKMFLLFIAILAITYCPSHVFAAEKEPTLQQQIPKDVLKNGRQNFLTLTVENDLFGAGRDGDYTSGLRLTYFDVGENPRKRAAWLDGLIPTFSINETTSISYSVGHNLYTPNDITIRAPQPNERPWAAFLYGSMGLSSVTDNHVDDVEATIGVVGPWAQGELIQESFHDLIDTRDPSGWDNQIENEPGLILSWRRRWPETFVHDFSDLSFSVEPNIGASVGNIYTLAETGFTMRLTPQDGRWQDTPLLVKPSIPGSGFFQSQEKGLGWYLFGGLQGRAVACNIFLDGNTFEESPSVNKKLFVMDANAGIAVTYGNTRLSYTAVYRTKEFDKQKDAALFGALSLGYRF